MLFLYHLTWTSPCKEPLNGLLLLVLVLSTDALIRRWLIIGPPIIGA